MHYLISKLHFGNSRMFLACSNSAMRQVLAYLCSNTSFEEVLEHVF